MLVSIIILGILMVIEIFVLIFRKKMADRAVRGYYSNYSEKEMGKSKEEYRIYAEKSYRLQAIIFIILLSCMILLVIFK